jgi:hypothetical protein
VPRAVRQAKNREHFRVVSEEIAKLADGSLRRARGLSVSARRSVAPNRSTFRSPFTVKFEKRLRRTWCEPGMRIRPPRKRSSATVAT